MRSVSLADVMHPEKADVCASVYSRSTTVWGAVMNEICADLPVAMAVPEDQRAQGGVNRTPDDVPPKVPEVEEAPKISDTTRADEDLTAMPVGAGCFYLEGFVGCTLSSVAVLTTFAFELPAAICYCFAAGFYWIISAEACPILLKAIFMVVVRAFMVIDILLLTFSVLITEILGLVTGCVTSFFGVPRCFAAAQDWHLYVRKVCHLTRWAFREFHEGWALKRSLPSFDSEVDEPVSQQATNKDHDTSSKNDSKGRPIQSSCKVQKAEV